MSKTSAVLVKEGTKSHPCERESNVEKGIETTELCRMNLVKMQDNQRNVSIEKGNFEMLGKEVTIRKLETVLTETELGGKEADKKKFKVRDEDLKLTTVVHDHNYATVGTRFKRILCQLCIGCQASCGDCVYCQSGNMILCSSTKTCLDPRFESVVTNCKFKQKIDQNSQTPVKVRKQRCLKCGACKSEDCKKCKFCVDKAKFEFRCTICQIIPIKPNRSELYRHYSKAHFGSLLIKERNKFGHNLKICPFCNRAFSTKIPVSHLGQKHDMVEKFLPEEARIPKRGTYSNRRLSTKQVTCRVEKEVLETDFEEEAPKDFWIWPEIPKGFDLNVEDRRMRSCQTETLHATKINGFEIEFMEELKEDEINQNSLNVSDEVQSVMCRVCKQKFSGVKTFVLHIQNDHRMKGPGNLDKHFQTLVKCGYVLLIVDEKKSNPQENHPASKMIATSRICKLSSESAVINVTPEKIRCLGEDASVVTMRYTSRLDMKVTKEEQDPLQTSDNSQDLQVPTPVQSWLCGRSSGWDT
eukprot:GFUD01020673.1.p1 GENE.GFUD01020673.1~~GFUD01020673.1.p1  ORF type:complete len:526 (-),score=126.95 GFUD01020673.1:28-1605(-)